MEGYSVTSDDNNTVYATGRYSSSPITLYNPDGTLGTELPNSGSSDVFIARYGNPQFTRLFPVVLLTGGVSGDTLQYYHGSGEHLNIFSGLTPGEMYYWNYNTGSLTTNENEVTPAAFIGIAVSSTIMIVRPDTIIRFN